MADFGLQTFTVRHAQKKDIRRAYIPLIKLGIKKFEIARIDFNEKNAETVSSLVEEFGIEVVSIQVKPKYVFGKPERIIRFCKRVGCQRVVISMLPFDCILGGDERFYAFISRLDEAATLYAEQGITLAYHHHNWEYIKTRSGNRRMDELISKTERIKFVHDTYWTAKCGVDPVRQMRAFGDRLLGVHLRDLELFGKGLDVIAKNTVIGCGVLDFPEILSAAEECRAEYLVIEQKTKTPFEDILKSYNYLKEISEAID